ncbi:S-methyl-5'-thioadenosine phosphorylase [Candidatus Margulisiibacteriota bacterium]
MKIGIIGGSGFYSFLEHMQEIEVDTPYGKPSDKLALGTYKGKELVFLPRHGKGHTIPPHLVNYRANIHALKTAGVGYILTAAAAGSLQHGLKPGDFVVVDQFIDRSKGRQDTYFEGPKIAHISCAQPYCPTLGELAYKALQEHNLPAHEAGTVVVVNGPRFSTKAESKWFTSMGAHLVNMTQYPEVILARESEICYANISLITDYDAGFEGDRPTVNTDEAMSMFKKNLDKLTAAILSTVEKIDINKDCSCHHSLDSSFIS